MTTPTDSVSMVNLSANREADKERLRQTELYLSDMAAAAIAADQRAIQFCALLGVGITLAAQIEAESRLTQVIQIISLLALLLASGIAAYSARPKGAVSSGNTADTMKGPLDELLPSLANRNDVAAGRIRCSLEKSGNQFWLAMKVAALGVLLIVLQIILPHFLNRGSTP